MNIQFTIIGLAIIVVFYLLTSGVLILAGLGIKNRLWRRVVIAPLAVIALVLPWVHEALVAWNFKEVCKEAGTYIAEKVTTDGFYDDTLRSGYSNIDQWGYSFMEHRSADGKHVERIERTDGGWSTSVLDKPTAKYHFRRPLSDVDAGPAASCSEDVIIDSETHQTIARYRYCKRYASFPERVWLGLLHRGPIEYCPSGEHELKGLLYQHVLIPASKR